MKAILLAFSFLLLFSVIVFLNHKANREFILASDLYLKKQALLEKFYSKFQKDLYETAHPDPKTPEQNKSNEVKEHVIIKRSIFNRDNEKGKVNLAFLIDHERYPATKERIAEALLEMYGASSLRPALIQTKEEAMGLLEDIGEAMKNASASDLLCDLKLSRHRAMFYHLLQGTQKFDIEKKLGFVPFQDLFMFYTSNAKKNRFCIRGVKHKKILKRNKA